MKFLRRNKAGQTMVEFALTLPLLALLLFGIIQYGFIFSAYMTLRHGAHQTARALSLPSAATNSTSAKAIADTAITPMLDSSRLGSPVVSVATVVTANDAITVRLSYGLPLIIRFVVPNAIGNTLTITSQATYRKEGS